METNEYPYNFTVEDLIERYMRRFHEGPVVHGPAVVQASCRPCFAPVIFDPVQWGLYVVDFPAEVKL